jgi:hypothetical protein
MPAQPRPVMAIAARVAAPAASERKNAIPSGILAGVTGHQDHVTRVAFLKPRRSEGKRHGRLDH